MSFPKRCGVRPRRTPANETRAALDAAATRSLKGEGKNKMKPTYGLHPFNGYHGKAKG